MTSRSSLVNQIKHNCGRRVWVTAILALGFFVSLPLFYLGRISQLKHVYPLDTIRQIDHFLRFDAFTPNGNYYSTIGVALAAVICGITSFCYLNSRSQVDLYHSMPITKKTLFTVRFFSGYILFLLPFTVNLLISGVIAMFQSGVNGFQWGSLWKLFLVDNVYFLQIYLVVCLAVILTGNLLNNVIMSIAFLFGESFGRAIIQLLQNMFFTNYSYFNTNQSSITPVHDLIIRMGVKEYEYSIDIYQDFFGKSGHFYGLLLGVILLFVLTLFIYSRRASESAGKAIVFGKVEWLLKAYFTGLITFAGASFCQSVFVANSVGWYVFGASASFVLSHIILEILFRSDFRAAFQHMWHWGVNLVIVILAFCAFRFDWFSYDSYIPDRGKVESVAISFDELDDQIDYIKTVRHGISRDWIYVSADSYRLDNMEITDLSKVYELVEYAVKHTNKRSPWEGHYDRYAQYDSVYNMEKEDILTALSEVKQDPWQWSHISTEISFDIRYNLKDGRELYRNYCIDLTDEYVLSLIGAIYDQPAFKLAEYPILSEDYSDYYLGSVTFTSFAEYVTKKLTEDQATQLLNCYKADLSSLTFEEIKSEQGLGYLNFEYMNTNEAGSKLEYCGMTSANPIYPSFTNTIDCLSELGISAYMDPDMIELTKIKVSTVGYYEQTGAEFRYPYVEYDVEDNEKVQEILGSCSWRYNTQSIWGGMMLLDVEIEYKNKETGEIGWEYGEFVAGRTPDFVLEDMIREIQ